MRERTALGEKILQHWRLHCPRMVRELEKENRLDGAVQEAQERTGDLLYELVSVQKIEYQAAWEVATREWAFLAEEEDPPPSRKSNRKSNTKRKPPRRRRATSA